MEGSESSEDRVPMLDKAAVMVAAGDRETLRREQMKTWIQKTLEDICDVQERREESAPYQQSYWPWRRSWPCLAVPEEARWSSGWQGWAYLLWHTWQQHWP